MNKVEPTAAAPTRDPTSVAAPGDDGGSILKPVVPSLGTEHGDEEMKGEGSGARAPEIPVVDKKKALALEEDKKKELIIGGEDGEAAEDASPIVDAAGFVRDLQAKIDAEMGGRSV